MTKVLVTLPEVLDICPWRGRILVARVHYEERPCPGRVTGHAGGFGTLAGVAELCSPGPERVARQPGQLREQSRSPAGDIRYGLVWRLASTLGIGGSYPGPLRDVAGNRLWLEPESDYAVVVLGNRVHPVRADRAPFNSRCRDLLDGVRARMD